MAEMNTVSKDSVVTNMAACYFLAANRLIKKSDIATMSYTVYEHDSMRSSDRVAVDGFSDVAVDVSNCFFDELQSQSLFVQAGGSMFERKVMRNCVYDVASRNIGGVLTSPFPVAGKYYTMVLAIEFNESTWPPLIISNTVQRGLV